MYLTCRKDCMQSPTREEMMKLWMYDTVVDKNDAVIYAQKKNDASCECTIQFQMYKRRMIQLQKNNDASCECTMQLRVYKKRMLKNMFKKEL